jgi:phosphatidate cytidylyltransferase
MVALALVMRPARALERSLGGAATTVFGVFYVAVPFALLVAMHQGNGHYPVLYVLILTWAGDTAAYYVGRSLGRHKLAPRVSPGKTWEGTAGSLLAAMILGYFFLNYFAPQAPLWLNLATAAAVNVAGQVGDLAESALKRSAGVKDSAALLPGHGGVLDRIDALLFAIPVMWYDLEILLHPYISR